MGVLAVAIAAVAVSAVSAAVSYSQAERAEDKEHEARKAMAQDEIRRGKDEADRIRKAAGRIKSAQTAALGASGAKIGEGSAAELLFETDTLSEMDALTALRESQARASLIQKGGGVAPSGASYALDVLQTGLQAYGKYKQGQNTLLEQAATKKSTILNTGAGSGSFSQTTGGGMNGLITMPSNN